MPADAPPLEPSREKMLQDALDMYFKDGPGYSLAWILEQIGADKAQARSIVQQHFKRFAHTQKYEDLMAATPL